MVCRTQILALTLLFAAGCARNEPPSSNARPPGPRQGVVFATAEALDGTCDLESLRVVYISSHIVLLWQYLTPEGKAVLALDYPSCDEFHEGLAAVGTSVGEHNAITKYGYIDGSGEIVIKPEYDRAERFHDGRAVVGKRGKFGVIDTSGKVIVPLEYDLCGEYRDGVGWGLKRDSEKRFYFDTSGKVLFDICEHCTDSLVFSEGLIFVNRPAANALPVQPPMNQPGGQHEREIGYIDTAGKLVVPVGSNVLSGFGFQEGLAVARLSVSGTRYGYLGKDGKLAIPGPFSDASSFSEGRAAAMLGGDHHRGWGYIDRQGKTAIPPRFCAAGPFSEGLAPVMVLLEDIPTQDPQEQQRASESGAAIHNETPAPPGRPAKWGFIDMAGTMVITPRFDRVTENFRDGLARVRQGKYYGFIDKNGNWVWRGTASVPPTGNTTDPI